MQKYCSVGPAQFYGGGYVTCTLEHFDEASSPFIVHVGRGRSDKDVITLTPAGSPEALCHTEVDTALPKGEKIHPVHCGGIANRRSA